ncbi:hypothetical protein FRACYDRAFT_251311 [Fragilariopsis cylindrus CCMP1102]|uniref:Uncharacterized protein n=1 Tax=Fragilariopsis cylindrus CCMP1102 TaxID=635003 RepID=A0A1E7EN31_9STRA|nr:hypothetical protein FRACYDRAFT_251311 [Fragilariopsis cylindrus CCMP1102]|eukprot:OEU07247.1 hypothetical protein FRACYDRAFT_251311 [Fragilariopsis cylindrus CCMP1102]
MLFKNSVFVAAMLLSPSTVVGRTLKANKGDKGADKRVKRLEEKIDALTTLVEQIVGNNDKDDSALGEVCGQAIAGKSACESEASKKKFLFVQTGMNCELTLTGDGKAKLVTDDISDTFQFADFPFRDEEELSTSDFILRFPRSFPKGPPNAAITFISSDDEDMALATPLVAIFSNPMMVGGGISYDIEQSPNQDDVLSIESLFTNGNTTAIFHCKVACAKAERVGIAECSCKSACVAVKSECDADCLADVFAYPSAIFSCKVACAKAERDCNC